MGGFLHLSAKYFSNFTIFNEICSRIMRNSQTLYAIPSIILDANG